MVLRAPCAPLCSLCLAWHALVLAWLCLPPLTPVLPPHRCLVPLSAATPSGPLSPQGQCRRSATRRPATRTYASSTTSGSCSSESHPASWELWHDSHILPHGSYGAITSLNVLSPHAARVSLHAWGPDASFLNPMGQRTLTRPPSCLPAGPGVSSPTPMRRTWRAQRAASTGAGLTATTASCGRRRRRRTGSA